MPSREDLGGRVIASVSAAPPRGKATNSSDTPPAPTLGRSGIAHGRQGKVCRKPIGVNVQNGEDFRYGINGLETNNTAAVVQSPNATARDCAKAIQTRH